MCAYTHFSTLCTVIIQSDNYALSLVPHSLLFLFPYTPFPSPFLSPIQLILASFHPCPLSPPLPISTLFSHNRSNDRGFTTPTRTRRRPRRCSATVHLFAPSPRRVSWSWRESEPLQRRTNSLSKPYFLSPSFIAISALPTSFSLESIFFAVFSAACRSIVL